MKINKKILIDYIYKTSSIGPGVIIDDVEVLNIKDDGLETTMIRKTIWGDRHKTMNRPSLYVNVYFDNGGRKNKLLQNLSYPHFVEYNNSVRINKLNKIKEKINGL